MKTEQQCENESSRFFYYLNNTLILLKYTRIIILYLQILYRPISTQIELHLHFREIKIGLTKFDLFSLLHLIS